MHVLVLNVPGLNLRFLGCYGNDWMDTSALDQLAAEGVVFDQHYADCLAGWPSSWTGRFAFPWLARGPLCELPDLQKVLRGHGVSVERLGAREAKNKPAPPFPVRLRKLRRAVHQALDQLAAEARGLLWVDLPPLSPPWSVDEEYLTRYFPQEEVEAPDDFAEEDYAEDQEKELESEAAETQDLNHGAEEEGECSHQIAEILPAKKRNEEPSPLLDPPPQIGMEEDRLMERVQLTYAAVLAQVDAFLADLLDRIRKRWPLADLTILVTAERGLALGEHGLIGDAQPWLHEEVFHLPLILRLPQAQHAGRRIAALTQPVDLFATLLDLFDRPIP